jgi:peptidoglycan/xylan/chitin deacetylase (PgdA/CDA1 family)
MVVVDTEEEFDWNSPPDSNQTSVGSMAHIDRVQSICSQYGIRPCYVIDYPVASQKTGYESLARYAAAGECEIGAHLHPWVNPPIREDITVRNMYPGNLDTDLERAKLLKLRNTIESLTGQRPQVYKAGRYGFGPNTANLLAELGFTVDVSVSPPIDHSGDGGPDHSWANSKPFWFGRELLEVPTTGAFVGWAHPLGRPLFSMAQRLRRLRAPGVLARLSAVDRLMLSPEGFTSDEHIKLTRFLLKQGVRTFTWSFHSPSVEPGHTDYVKTEADLERFLASFTTYFDFFFNELGGVPTSPLQLRSYLETVQ